MIKLPTKEWFFGQIMFRGQGNTFSGSFGSDPYYGCMDKKTFRYRVWIDKNEEEQFILKAVYYIGDLAYEATDKSIVTEKVFDADENGIHEAEKWIEESFNSVF